MPTVSPKVAVEVLKWSAIDGRLGRNIFIAIAEMLARTTRVNVCGCDFLSKNRGGSNDVIWIRYTRCKELSSCSKTIKSFLILREY